MCVCVKHVDVSVAVERWVLGWVPSTVYTTNLILEEVTARGLCASCERKGGGWGGVGGEGGGDFICEMTLDGHITYRLSHR